MLTRLSGQNGFRRSRIAFALAAGLSVASTAAAQSSNQPPKEGLLENLSLFVGPDGSKQPQDLGINANMGIRFSANWGFPIAEKLNLGAQIGAASNLSDAAVHVLDQIDGPSHRTQTFLTLGVFQRPTPKLNWGLAYDVSLEHYYDDFHFGQLRAQSGYSVSGNDEVGVWLSKSLAGDDGYLGTTAVRLDPITQVNGYLKHNWANGAQTAVWAGVANQHHNIVWVFPDNSRDSHVLVYGAELSVPLSDRFALTGATNLMTPAATGTVDAYMGVTFYPTRSGFRAARNRFAPLFCVANNPTMAIDMRR
jgi:uncharacterized protein DUF6666